MLLHKIPHQTDIHHWCTDFLLDPWGYFDSMKCWVFRYIYYFQYWSVICDILRHKLRKIPYGKFEEKNPHDTYNLHLVLHRLPIECHSMLIPRYALNSQTFHVDGKHICWCRSSHASCIWFGYIGSLSQPTYGHTQLRQTSTLHATTYHVMSKQRHATRFVRQLACDNNSVFMQYLNNKWFKWY